MSNVSKEVRALKTKGMKMLKAGLDAQYIAGALRVSKKLVKEWEDEYVREVLSDGQGQRVRMRAMLMRMTPQVLMGLHKLATQEIEPRMQLAASQTLVRFGMAFMREDTALTILEDDARGSLGAKLVESTLFDLQDGISGDYGDAIIAKALDREEGDEENATLEDDVEADSNGAGILDDNDDDIGTETVAQEEGELF